MSLLWYFTLVIYHGCAIIINVEVRKMRIDIKSYLEDNGLTIYVISKKSGYGYTTLHKSFNKKQTSATSMNLRDIEAIAKAQDTEMWKVLRELELHYLK
nr:DNA gyrase modulator [Companilactobacillus mindensis]